MNTNEEKFRNTPRDYDDVPFQAEDQMGEIMDTNILEQLKGKESEENVYDAGGVHGEVLYAATIEALHKAMNPNLAADEVPEILETMDNKGEIGGTSFSTLVEEERKRVLEGVPEPGVEVTKFPEDLMGSGPVPEGVAGMAAAVAQAEAGLNEGGVDAGEAATAAVAEIGESSPRGSRSTEMSADEREELRNLLLNSFTQARTGQELEGLLEDPSIQKALEEEYDISPDEFKFDLFNLLGTGMEEYDAARAEWKEEHPELYTAIEHLLPQETATEAEQLRGAEPPPPAPLQTYAGIGMGEPQMWQPPVEVAQQEQLVGESLDDIEGKQPVSPETLPGDERSATGTGRKKGGFARAFGALDNFDNAMRSPGTQAQGGPSFASMSPRTPDMSMPETVATVNDGVRAVPPRERRVPEAQGMGEPALWVPPTPEPTAYERAAGKPQNEESFVATSSAGRQDKKGTFSKVLGALNNNFATALKHEGTMAQGGSSFEPLVQRPESVQPAPGRAEKSSMWHKALGVAGETLNASDAQFGRALRHESPLYGGPTIGDATNRTEKVGAQETNPTQDSAEVLPEGPAQAQNIELVADRGVPPALEQLERAEGTVESSERLSEGAVRLTAELIGLKNEFDSLGGRMEGIQAEVRNRQKALAETIMKVNQQSGKRGLIELVLRTRNGTPNITSEGVAGSAADVALQNAVGWMTEYTKYPTRALEQWRDQLEQEEIRAQQYRQAA